jgi:hypothetical protein
MKRQLSTPAQNPVQPDAQGDQRVIHVRVYLVTEKALVYGCTRDV